MTRLTVLHIDDDADTRLLVREVALEPVEGASIEHLQWLEAAGVAEALCRYAGEHIDVVLLDHRLGPENGGQLLPRLKAAWGCPIWLLTGLPVEALSANTMLGDAAGVISKDELLEGSAAIRRVLSLA